MQSLDSKELNFADSFDEINTIIKSVKCFPLNLFAFS